MIQNQDLDVFKVNCSNCGEITLNENQLKFFEDETTKCTCGQKLNFVRDYNGKKNTYGFDE